MTDEEIKRKTTMGGKERSRWEFAQTVWKSVTEALGGVFISSACLEFPLVALPPGGGGVNSPVESPTAPIASLVTPQDLPSPSPGAAAVVAASSPFKAGLSLLSPPLIKTMSSTLAMIGSTSSPGTSSRDLGEGSPLPRQLRLRRSSLPPDWTETPSSKASVAMVVEPDAEDIPPLPPSLLIAGLDDSLLVRKNMQHTFQRHLHASPDSFVRGATYQESLFFPHEIVLTKVDIAIFDENLNYYSSNSTSSSTAAAEGETDDDKILKGTALVVKARKNGFRGCAILHSANLNLASNLNPAFDGFIEKTSSRERFTRELSRIWAAFQACSQTPDQ